MPDLRIDNHGPLIRSTNYWGSDLDKAGTLYLSQNAGAFRLLLPSGWEEAITEMHTSTHVLVSRGPWARDPGCGLDSLELLFEDESTDPYVIHLESRQADRLPTAEDQGKEWVFSAWIKPRRGNPPRKALERQCWYRLVESVPWLKPR